MNDAHEPAQSTRNFGRAFAAGIALNSGFVALEAFYGWQAGSLALLADAGHNLSDVGGLLLAWAAWGAGQLRPDMRHTYGWRRASILAGFINAVVLLVAMASLAWEAVRHLQTPAGVDAGVVMLVAGAGVLVNAATAWLFLGGSKQDLNIRGAFLHMAGDALVSVGVVLSGVLYLWLDWPWIDPLVTLLIVVAVVIGSWSLLRRTLHLLFDGVPEEIDLATVQSSLLGLPGILGLHELHVWALSTSEIALTAHLVCDGPDIDRDVTLSAAQTVLQQRFGISHATLQLESPHLAETCNAACSR